MADGVIYQSKTHTRIRKRFAQAGGDILPMFDELDVGWSSADVHEYVRDTPMWELMKKLRIEGWVMGMVLTVAALCVEKERETMAEKEGD